MVTFRAALTGRQFRAREDRRRIYLAKTTRAAGYGALSAFLFYYLELDFGYSSASSLLITALTLAGTAFWNFVALPPLEHRWGRRRTLWVFGGLFTLSALLLFLAASPWIVIAAVLLGGVAASSADNGPLASLDQAILPSTLRRADRTEGFARYNLIGIFASSAGALLISVPNALQPTQLPILPAAPHPWILLVYLVLAGMTWFGYSGLSAAVETPEPSTAAPPPRLSDATQRHLSALIVLFGLDSFAGGLVINPFLVAYFATVWHQSPGILGFILFVVGIVAGLSFLLAGLLADRFGLLNTMVFSHLPSNVLLILVPLMPTFSLAFAVLVVRFALSQLDVPTRQSYTMLLASNRERVVVAARLGGTRSLGQAAGPFPMTGLVAAGLLTLPFELAGALKIVYDVALLQRFRRVPLPEEPIGPSRGTSTGDGPTSPSSPPRGG